MLCRGRGTGGHAQRESNDRVGPYKGVFVINSFELHERLNLQNWSDQTKRNSSGNGFYASGRLDVCIVGQQSAKATRGRPHTGGQAVRTPKAPRNEKNSFLVNFARSAFGVRGVLSSLSSEGHVSSMRMVYAVVQFSAPQCVEKCCVAFELVSNRVPNDPRFSVTLRQFRNQNVKRVIDSAALVMHNIIIAANRCPNQSLPWESWVRDSISHVPILARVRELALVVSTNGNNGWWQVLGGMNVMELRGILQDLAILSRKLCYICTAQAWKRDGEKEVEAESNPAGAKHCSHGAVSPCSREQQY